MESAWAERAASSSELLGFPADARILIINCDDLGMHRSINTAVLSAVQDGVGLRLRVQRYAQLSVASRLL